MCQVKETIIVQPASLGDILICFSGVARIAAMNPGVPHRWPVWSRYRKTLDGYVTAPNIHFEWFDANSPDHAVFVVSREAYGLEESDPQTCVIDLTSGFPSSRLGELAWRKDGLSFDAYKYAKLLRQPLDVKYNLHYYLTRNEAREDTLMAHFMAELPEPSRPYDLLQLQGGNGVTWQAQGWDDTENLGVMEDRADVSMFDWWKVINGAKRFAAIDSAPANMADLLGLAAGNRWIHPRRETYHTWNEMRLMTPSLKEDWKLAI
jgi:hypothetical protein